VRGVPFLPPPVRSCSLAVSVCFTVCAFGSCLTDACPPDWCVLCCRVANHGCCVVAGRAAPGAPAAVVAEVGRGSAEPAEALPELGRAAADCAARVTVASVPLSADVDTVIVASQGVWCATTLSIVRVLSVVMCLNFRTKYVGVLVEELYARVLQCARACIAPWFQLMQAWPGAVIACAFAAGQPSDRTLL